MNWRSLKIWLPITVICLGVLVLTPMSKKEAPSVEYRLKSLPMHPGVTPPLAAIPPKTDYMDIVLKVGGLSGAIMSCVSLVEKAVKLIRRKG